MDRSVSVPMTLSDLERRDARNRIFKRISLITLVPFDVERQFARITHVGRGVFLWVNDAHTARGRGPSGPILGFPFICADTFGAEVPYMIFHMITHTGKGFVCTWSATPTPSGRGPSAPQFWGSLLFMHIPFVAELPNLTCRVGAYILGSATPPTPRERSSSFPQFLALFIPTYFNAELPNLAW